MQNHSNTILFISNSVENINKFKNIIRKDIKIQSIHITDTEKTSNYPQTDVLIFDYTITEDYKEKILKDLKNNVSNTQILNIKKTDNLDFIIVQIENAIKSKELQDELLKEKAQTTYIFEHTDNELMLTDTNFNIIYQNNKILPKTEQTKINFIDLIKENKEPEVIESVEQFIKNSKKEITFRLILNEGIDKKIAKTTLCKIHKNNKLCGYLVIMNDMSIKFQRNQQREYFIEMLTHDLKTPILAEERALHLLYKGLLGELNSTQKEMVKDIINSSKCLQRMTDNVLITMRHEANSLKLNKKLNKIKQTIEYCINDTKFLFEDSNQKIKINIEPDCNEFIYDNELVQKIIVNILTNASEHSPKNSIIYITIKKQNEHINVSIRDEGQGISKEKYNNLFKERTCLNQRFKKVGSGLGLFISKNIMEMHDGSITVQSKENEGSEFILSFPIKTKTLQKKEQLQTIPCENLFTLN